MTYAPNDSQQLHGSARYHGDGYPDTRTQAPYHGGHSYMDPSAYGSANNQAYVDMSSQRPGTAAGYMQPSTRQHIASPSPTSNPDPYDHQHHYQQQQQHYPEPAAVSGYYGATQSFDLPSRPGTAPGNHNVRIGGAVPPNDPGRGHDNGFSPAPEAGWTAGREPNGAYANSEMAAAASYSQNRSTERQPPNFHKPQTGYRPPPQREDTYYSDPGTDAARGPISPVHPNAPNGMQPHGRGPPQGRYGRPPPRGPPGTDSSHRGYPRDPRKGPPPGSRPGRHGPPGTTRDGNDARGDKRGDHRGDYRGDLRGETRGGARGDHRPGSRPRDVHGVAPGPNGRGLPASPGTKPEYDSRSQVSPRPGDASSSLSPLAGASQPAGPVSRKDGTSAGIGPGSTGSQHNRRRLSDALPSHPTPVRPGLMQLEQASQRDKVGPIRQYDGQPASQAMPNPNGSGTRRQSVPVTLEELASLRRDIERQPSDQSMRLRLAKKLVEATLVLADEGGRADIRTRNKNRERYVTEALQLVKRLVAESYPEGQFYMADCLGSGVLGVPNDAKEAFTLYQSAAKAGHAQAAYRTAVCCELGPDEGGGTRRDTLKAFQWYKRAAALGDQPSMYKVGMIQLKGLLGQAVNPGEAVTWLKRAVEFADEQNPHAIHELGCLYDSRAPQRLVESSDARALELFTKAANFGFKRSQFRLGEAYEYGLLSCPIDARNSIIWYTRAAAQGEHQSELALSGWYLTGSEGILEHSDTEAYLWARKAALAEPPLAKAMFALGYYTEVGIGCPRSLEEAKKWYSRAAAHRFPKAQERLEELRRGGAKVQKNRENLSRKNQRQQEAECSVM